MRAEGRAVARVLLSMRKEIRLGGSMIWFGLITGIFFVLIALYLLGLTGNLAKHDLAIERNTEQIEKLQKDIASLVTSKDGMDNEH